MLTCNNIDYFVFTGLNDLICALILVPMLYTIWYKNKTKLIDYPDDFVQQAKDNAVENEEQNIIIHNDSK